MRRCHRTKPAARQQGATLIEVLISMAIIGIALIGAAALQIQLLQNVQEQTQRTQISVLAGDLSGRITVNSHDLAGYRCTACAINTSPTTIAEQDLTAIISSATNVYNLPSFRLDITQPNASDAELTLIKMYWDALRNGATGTGCDPASATDLACYQITIRP